MRKGLVGASAMALIAGWGSAWAQNMGDIAGAAAAAQRDSASPAVEGQPEPQPAPPATAAANQEIIVTATKRIERASTVPLAVSVASSEAMELAGANDIRELTAVVPSLFVSRTSSEAGGGVTRVRGIGTVGDNPGLESSVPVFIDGVYRSRGSIGITELGAVERVEVLRGPQGTLFGRNASAGLINVILAQPSFESRGTAEFSYGNYDHIRAGVGITGPIISDNVAMRFDGVYVKRDGFDRDAISGRDIHNRDRYLVRGQLLYEPTDDLRVRLVGDYTNRDEECCGGIYAPLVDRVRAPGTPAGEFGEITLAPSSFLPVLQSLRDPAGNPLVINSDPDRREVAITPGQGYRSEVDDWGVAGHVEWSLGAVNLTSITAYRDWRWQREQDNDFTNLDLFYRPDWDSEFKTFTQELRLQGTLFDDRLDWLVGGYYADEQLNIEDSLRFGSQFGDLAAATLAYLAPNFSAFPALGGYANLPGFFDAALATSGVPAAARGLVTSQIAPINLNDVGITRDLYKQNSRNWALFTHNRFSVTDKLKLTVGLRYTREKKEIDLDLRSDNSGCASIGQSIANLSALGASNPALAQVASNVTAGLNQLAAVPCLVNLNTTLDGVYAASRREGEWSGTAALSYQFTNALMAYVSYSRGYKAGGFNLDRSALNPLNPSAAELGYEPETVDAFEVGAKFDGRLIDLELTLFRQIFDQFQLNTFNGANFLVENIRACGDELAPTPSTSPLVYGACSTGDLKGGVISEGVEVEARASPIPDVATTVGFTYANTHFRERLVGVGGRPLANDLFRLPGRNLSNAPEYSVTGALTWTPPVGVMGMSALFHADARYQSEYNTGSDLDIEKEQDGLVLVNARVGLRGPENRWSLEFWAENLFDTSYKVIGFDAPLQPIGGVPGSRVVDLPAGARYSANRSNALYGRFLGDPRTYGVTVRTTF
jgi:iron complex outermembrane receptor protein